MDKHTCKLCFRSFANGRALGGHMRSHVAASTKAAAQLIKDSSYSSPSESSSSRDEDDDKMMMVGPLGYGLRENPRKSFRLVDPEFSSNFPAVDAAAAAATPLAGSSIVVQDRESETESSRAPTTTHRRRSKRARKAAAAAAAVVSQPDPHPLAEHEPVSSVSDTTPEEDVAISLMMLSRDFWAPVTKSEEQQQSGQQFIVEDEEYEDEIEVEAYRARNRNNQHHQHPVKGRSKYQCGTCKKVFRSYQALGGHRASHKKNNGCVPPPSPVATAQFQIHNEGGESSEANAERVQHECPVCFRVFSSGQALGGHKRSHLTNSSAATIALTSSNPIAPAPPAASIAAVAATKYESFIDLNLPAPMEDDAELSAVSDAEFVMARSSK